MEAITVQEMALATGGTLYGEKSVVVRAVSTDSRSVGDGAWFVPLKGERFDGHDYIDMALEHGAAGCFCARLPESLRSDKAYILVEDTKRALKELASWYRGKFNIPIIQVTGSVGKTTTKEMIAAVLQQGLCTHKTQGNLNGDIGAPLTMLKLTCDHEVAVIETGMDNFGQIRYLGEMIRPDFAVISNIGDAHMEYLGSREGILRAKSEIFEHLSPNGVAVLNGDDDLLQTLTLPFETLRCGMGEHCNIRIEEVKDGGVAGVSCTVHTPQAVYRLEIPAAGVHMVYAAAIAVAIAERLGLTVAQIEQGVRTFTPTGERMRIEHLRGNRLLLNDSYNANPQSMAAALHILAATDSTKRIAVLGDMKELGDATEAGHREMGRLVGALGIDTLFAVGAYCKEYMIPAARLAGCPDVRWYEDRTACREELLQAYREGAAVLLKASHFSGRFDLLADDLRETLGEETDTSFHH